MNGRLRQFIADLQQTWREWGEDDGSLLAAAVAYYAALSLFPLLLVLISGLGLFLQFTQHGQNAEQRVLDAIAEQGSPLLRDQVAAAMSQLKGSAPANGPVGLLTLLLGAISIFAQFERAFDRVWNVEDPERRGVLAALRSALYERARAFLMLLCVGLLILVIFLAGLAFDGVQKRLQPWLPEGTNVLWSAAQFVVSAGLNALAFAVLYRFLPKRPVQWRDALKGGALVAVTWEIGRQVLATYLVGSKYSNAYGVIGSFLAIMLWVYYASTIVLIGCEYVQVVGRRNGAAGVGETRPD